MSSQLISTFVAVCFALGFTTNVQVQGLPTLILENLVPPKVENYLSSQNVCIYGTKINCTDYTYRMINGSCSDKSNFYFGRSATPYVRDTMALYGNGVNTSRTKGFLGHAFPDPRDISVNYFQEGTNPQTELTLLLAVFARFIEHDLYKTQLFDDSACCTPSLLTDLCNNITVSASDAFFKTYRRTCLPKARCVPSPPLDCTAGPIQQVNENTHLLDLSNIYGSTEEVSNKLRTKADGLLKESATNNLLPKSNLSKCQLPASNPNDIHCFMAGDDRVNNDVLIMTMYTMWVRAHNDIAKKVKPIITITSDDETIFQISRKILIGMYQHIVYNEFLPALDANNTLGQSDKATNKVATVSPEIANIFSIAFTGLVDTMMNNEFTIGSTVKKLEDVWYNPQELWAVDGGKNIVNAMLGTTSGQVDRYVVEALTNKYLQISPGQGNDKVALNVQQARENGMVNYFIMFMILSKKFNQESYDYSDFTNMNETALAQLKIMYPSVFDVELLPGLFGENPKGSGIEYGNMMKTLMDKQFKRLKDGDSFYYEHTNIFPSEQLAEIKKATMAKLMCSYAPLPKIAPLAFKIIDASSNAEADCSTLSETNICIWATVDWTSWISTPCMGGIIVSTRECLFLSGSSCKCQGPPVKFNSCPMGLVNPILDSGIVTNFLKVYNKEYDDQGNHISSNSTISPVDILKSVI